MNPEIAHDRRYRFAFAVDGAAVVAPLRAALMRIVDAVRQELRDRTAIRAARLNGHRSEIVVRMHIVLRARSV